MAAATRTTDDKARISLPRKFAKLGMPCCRPGSIPPGAIHCCSSATASSASRPYAKMPIRTFALSRLPAMSGPISTPIRR